MTSPALKPLDLDLLERRFHNLSECQLREGFALIAEVRRLRDALAIIRDMKPSELAPETYPGIVHGPQLLLDNCQRIARRALSGGSE